MLVFVLAAALPRDSISAPLPQASGLSAPVIAGEVWSSAGGGSAGSRATTARLAPAATVAWQVDASAAIVALGADQDRVYVSFADGRLVALDATTGVEAWSMSVPGQLDEPPVIVGGQLYLSLRSSEVAVVEAATGGLVWSRSVPSLGFVWSAPVVVEGLLWVAGQRALNILDAQTGQPLQVRNYDRMIGASPVLAGDYVALATTGQQLVFERASAAKTFNYPLGGILHLGAHGTQTVVLTDDAMASTRADASAHWWENERLRAFWTNAWAWGIAPSVPAAVREWNIALSAHPYAPALDEATVFVTDTAGAARAYALADGALLWDRPSTGAAAAPVLTAGGLLVPASAGLLLLDAEGGKEVNRWALTSAPTDLVVTAGGTYVAGMSSSEDGGATITALR